MSTNGTQVFIVDGVDGYIYTIATNTLATIATAEFLGGDVGTFLDGYFVTNQPNTQNYQISASYDEDDVEQSGLWCCRGQPDNLVSLAAMNGQLWLFGQTTSEVHYNTGDADFPFARVPGAIIQRGLCCEILPGCWE